MIIDAVRTPVGRFRGALAGVRPDDLAADAVEATVTRSGIDPASVCDVYMGAANQAGEDNRDVARMAALLAGLPVEVPGVTVNRLCASGLDAVNQASRALRLDEGDVYLAGGVESMSRAPWIVAKPETAQPRGPQTMHDTALGWRLINPRMAELYSTEAMGETAENVADRYGISREDQDAWALRSHQRAVEAIEAGRFGDELVPLSESRPTRARAPTRRSRSSPACAPSSARAAASPPAMPRPSMTAPPASRSPQSRPRRRWAPIRWVASSRSGLPAGSGGDGDRARAGDSESPRGGRTPARRDRPDRDQRGFAAQVLACAGELGIDPERLNVNGGAIALGHPLGCSGARILTTLLWEMRRRGARYGIAALCVGVGQGLATVVENPEAAV